MEDTLIHQGRKFYSASIIILDYLNKISRKIILSAEEKIKIKKERRRVIRTIEKKARDKEDNYSWVNFIEKNGKTYFSKENYCFLTDIVGAGVACKILRVNEYRLLTYKRRGIIYEIKNPLIRKGRAYFSLSDILNREISLLQKSSSVPTDEDIEFIQCFAEYGKDKIPELDGRLHDEDNLPGFQQIAALENEGYDKKGDPSELDFDHY